MKLLSKEKQKIINQNIRIATAHANCKVMKIRTPMDISAWNQAYHVEMDRLCKNDKVRV